MAMTEVKQYFFQQVKQGTLSHAYLFVGDDTVQKDDSTTAIMQAMVCPNFLEMGQPCFECEHCRRIQANQWADVYRVVPETKTIKIDQIRELREWLMLSPIESHCKFAIIEQAETMNAASANALLTILEEPKSEVYILLYVNEANNILPTIQSRAQQIRFKQPTVLTFENSEFESLSAVYKRRLIQLPYQTRAALMNLTVDDVEQWFKAYDELYQWLYLKEPLTFALIQVRMKQFITANYVNYGLDYLQLLNHQMIMYLTDNQSEVFQLIESIAQKQTTQVAELLRLNQQLIEAKQYLAFNVSPQLVVEKLVLATVK
ncbi:hypothetical protein I4Q36_00440 [Tuanshanicoccus lijuaniae]|uniref:hypothetical protein n=1 Tax=Aerococcaceae bacterium zg-1292 TaxID=2774330 RepID=UPI001937A495|nr:hypothetical protein [Aerococcaceae bacterium zg-1292]QQA37225.1 hypothetical protein I4Q36_00440 [Aerococcaceae bacterium zg-1292]